MPEADENKDGENGVKPEVDIDKIVNDKLAKIKENLDKAYAERDKALDEAKAIKVEAEKKETERLRTEGKELEALKIENESLKRELGELQTENVSLRRDQAVENAFSDGNQEFKNARSRKLAVSDIVNALVPDDKGNWKSAKGESISDFVKSYIEDPDNEFLFRAKVNKGSETDFKNKDKSSNFDGKKVTQIPLAERLKLAEKGGLRRRR